ncbi:MAG: LysM peptidoglycan-binding domain-containing protein [Vulcanimicrobiaceae bacterium]
MPAIMLAALGALVAVPALSQVRLHAAGVTREAHVVVRPGDTLWTIAGRYTARDAAVEDTVDAIVAANHLSNATIVPGERLSIPR